MDLNPFFLIHQSSKGGGSFLILLLSLMCLLGIADGYDPLDPNGNITIKWDIIDDNEDNQVVSLGSFKNYDGSCVYFNYPVFNSSFSVSSYGVTVSIFNYQLYRHIDHPGWKLSWRWPGDGVIWDMWGAEATEQGNCSAFKSGQRPHCCEKEPVIIDLLPGTRYNKQFLNCCKGGVLSSMTQDPEKYVAAFQMSIGRFSSKSSGASIPGNFTLGVPGYTCGEPSEVPPSKFVEDHGRRRTQAVGTWNITCSYSQFRAQSSPTCCVSLSAFYNKTIVSCPICTCGCEGQPGSAKCLKAGEQPPVFQLSPPPAVQCTRHMCPIRVHWHVKLSYTQHWRVKITITNYNFVKNFSQWNLVVLHPNLRNVTRVFSFNYRPLNQYGYINDTGMFYGIRYYNDMLLQAGEGGNVQTELLLNKDPASFTFREGWAFPRRISFNGEECVLPRPDDYPRLPNSAPANSAILQLLMLLFFLTFVV